MLRFNILIPIQLIVILAMLIAAYVAFDISGMMALVAFIVLITIL